MMRFRRSKFRKQRLDGAPVLVVGEPTQAGDWLGHSARLLWRYRSELAPVAAISAVWLVGAWLHAVHPTWWPGIVALAALVSAGMVAPPKRLAGRWPVLDRRVERLYAATTTAIAGAWLALASLCGANHPPLPTLALFGGVGCAVPWWAHRRRRARVRVERTISAWPDIAENIGLAGSRIMSAVIDRWGWTSRLSLKRGQTARDAIERIPAIESGLATRTGAVRIEPTPERADQAIMRVIETDPHADPISWPGATTTSVTRPLTLGVFEDGNPVSLSVLRRNVLVGGIVGSGKSGVVNAILAELSTCQDVALWGIDLKGGMELGPWRSCLGELATTPKEATELLAYAVAELEQRAASLAQLGERLWQPAPDKPALMIVIDEYAELPDAAHPYADSLGRRGRAVAETLLAATQRPTQRTMGHGAVRSQMDVRISLRVRERRDADLILGQGAHSAGWHPETLDMPGKFLISAPEHPVPKRARAYLITDKAVRQAAEDGVRNHPKLATATPDSPVATSPREDAETLLWRALTDAPEQGLSVGHLIEMSGKYRTWVYQRLSEWAGTGQVSQPKRGFWRTSRPEERP